MTHRRIRHLDLGVVPYGQAFALQRKLHSQLVEAPTSSIGTLITLQHPLTVTLGRRGHASALLGKNRLQNAGAEVYTVDRGGEATLHNPGQLVVYPIVKLEDYGLTVVDIVRKTAYAVADALLTYGVTATYDADLPGLWCDLGELDTYKKLDDVSYRKVASVGMRITKGTSTHGLALNVINDLTPFSWIEACGMRNSPMCRVVDLVPEIVFNELKDIVVKCWGERLAVELVEGEEELPGREHWVEELEGWRL